MTAQSKEQLTRLLEVIRHYGNNGAESYTLHHVRRAQEILGDGLSRDYHDAQQSRPSIERRLEKRILESS